MDKNTIDDAKKELADLKSFLNIKEAVGKLSGHDVYLAIKEISADWFTAKNLSELLQRIQSCEIAPEADDMLEILKLFKDNIEDLYFNNISKQILELTSSPSNIQFDCFKELLSFIITNINLEEKYDLEWNDDVLNKINDRKCTDITTLLNTWNSSGSTKNKPVDIIGTLDHIKVDKDKISYTDMKGLLDTLSEEQKSQFKNHKAICCILDKLADDNEAINMSELAKQLKDYLTEQDTTTILNKTSTGGVKDIYELVTQLELTKEHLKAILDKIEHNKSSATDMVKLVHDKLKQIGFGQTECKDVLKYLNDSQTMDDMCALLDMFEEFNITFTNELVGDIMNKSSYLSADEVCNLLDNFNSLGVKPNENRNLVDNIINKLASYQTVDGVSKLLQKLKDLNVPLNLNTNKKSNEVPNNDIVYLIVNQLTFNQSVQDLSKLVEVLQLYEIQPVPKVCKSIFSILGKNQKANDVTDLLIALGNFFGFDKIQKDSYSSYLPGFDSIFQHIADGQSKADMLKLAKVLIAMGKDLTEADELFRKKIGGDNYKTEENQDLEELLTLNPKDPKYKENQTEFVKEFTKEKKEFEEKKEDKQSEKKLISKFKTGNDADNIIDNSNIIEERIILRGKEKKTTINDSIFKINSEDDNINQHDNFNQSGYIIEKKINQTNGASNKKAVLKILGVALAILGILCIVLSLTIASEVLLSLLIPGCVLFTAGISILVRLFCKHKHDKPIDLSSGDEPPNLIGGNRNIYDIEQQYLLRKEQEYDDNGSTYQNNDGF